MLDTRRPAGALVRRKNVVYTRVVPLGLIFDTLGCILSVNM